MSRIVSSTLFDEDIVVRHNNRIPRSLAENNRHNVEFSFSCAGYVWDEGSGTVRLNLVVKFRFNSATLKLLVLPEDFKIDKLVPGFSIKSYDSGIHKIIPWSFTRATEWTPLVWSFVINEPNTSKDFSESGEKDLNCYERMELIATIPLLHFTRYFPFTVQVLAVRICLDGTGESSRLNLLPRRTKIGDFPDVDLDVFTAKTSQLRLSKVQKDPDSEIKSTDDANVMTMIRQQKVGGVEGVFTRVYAVMLFSDGVQGFENFFKYIMISSILSFFIPLSLSAEDITMEQYRGDGVVPSIVLTQAALLFILPDKKNEFNSTEMIIVIQMIVGMSVHIYLCLQYPSNDMLINCEYHNALYVMSGMVGVCMLLLIHAYFKHLILKNRIKTASAAVDDSCDYGNYERVEKMI